MDQALQKLIRELKAEKCPPTVLDRVAERIASEKATMALKATDASVKTPVKAPPPGWRLWPSSSLSPSLALAVAVAIACLLGAGALGLWQAHRETQRLAAERAAAEAQTQARLQAQRAVRARVARETRVAFGYIGQALVRAAAQTENVLSKEAVPPLRNSFETVKNKVTDPI